MNIPRKFIDIVIPFNNEYLNLQILLPKIYKLISSYIKTISPKLSHHQNSVTKTKTQSNLCCINS